MSLVCSFLGHPVYNGRLMGSIMVRDRLLIIDLIVTQATAKLLVKLKQLYLSHINKLTS